LGSKRVRGGVRTVVEMTPDLLASIVNLPLGSPDSAVLLTGLSNKDAESTRIVRNARRVLDALSQGPQKLTEKTRQLNRRFVRAMFEQLELDEAFVEIRRGWRLLDEDQVWPLAALRHVMQIAGLLRVLHGRVLITKRGQQFRDPERAGDLHRLLFETYFLRYNIAATDRYPEDSVMQEHLAFTLFRFGTLLREPMPLVDFADRLPHDEDVWMGNAAFSEFGFDPDWQLHGALTRRILEPLVDFGMLSSRAGVPAKDRRIAALREDTDRRWSITPLFDRFVALSIGEQVVGLGNVLVQAPASAERMVPADERMSVRESVAAFSHQLSGGDPAMEQMLSAHLMMLELAGAAPFLSASSGSKTPVERAIAEIPRLMTMARDVDANKSRAVEATVIAAVFASYVSWCVQVGQARHEVGARAMVSLERWLPGDVVADIRSSLN